MYVDINAALESLPYITRLRKPYICDKWITIDDRRTTCRKSAAWKFTKSSTKGKGRHSSGYFCTGHLLGVVQGSLYEKARANRAYDKVTKLGES